MLTATFWYGFGAGFASAIALFIALGFAIKAIAEKDLPPLRRTRDN